MFFNGQELTVNNEFKPQTTSFNRRVGAQPRPSMEFWRNSDKQMSPVTEIFGCQSFVTHFTFGGCINKLNYKLAFSSYRLLRPDQNRTVMLYSSGTVATNLNFPSFQKPSSGVMIKVNSHNTFGSLKNTLQVLGIFCSISWTSFTNNLSRIDMRLVFSLAVEPETSFFSFLVNVIIFLAAIGFVY